MAENSASTKAMLDIIKRSAAERMKVLTHGPEKTPPVTSKPKGISQLDEAIIRFQNCYLPLFAAECRRYDIPFDQIHDLFQDILLKLVMPRIDLTNNVSTPPRILKYQELPGSLFRSWVRVTFRRHVLDYLKTSRAETSGTGGTSHLLALSTLQSDSEESIHDREDDWDLEAIKSVASQLHAEYADDAEVDKCWLAFHIVYIEGKTLRSASEEMGSSHETMRRWSQRFREMLLAKLRDPKSK